MLQRDQAMLQRDQAMLQRNQAVLQRDQAVLQLDDASRHPEALILDRSTVSVRNGVPVFLITVPKSGSIFMLENLSRGLDYRQVSVSPGYFPDDLINSGSILEMQGRATIAQSHISAHPINIAMVRQFVGRFWLHLRDPRAATLSWVHHVESFADQPYVWPVFSPALPEGYFGWPVAEKLAWQVNNYLPNVVSWTSAWVAAIDAGVAGPSLITRYEDFSRNEEATLRQALDFFGIPQSAFKGMTVPKSAATHFRAGQVDEWRAAFSEADKRQACRLIPQSLADRFDWPLE
jgi:hypothetical protein